MMIYISYKFYPYWIKYVAIGVSELTNILLIVYLIQYSDLGLFDEGQYLLTLIILGCFIVLTSIMSYFLFISKEVILSGQKMHINSNNSRLYEVDVSCISSIKRKFYFFYLIDFHSNCGVNSPVLYFISPNPSLTAGKKKKNVR